MRAQVLSMALSAELPRDRSAAAASLLAADPGADEVTALLTAHDAVVREITVSAPGRTADQLADVLLREEAPAALRATLQALGRHPDATSVRERAQERVAALAASAPFGVRAVAQRLASAWGLVVQADAPALPGPPEVHRLDVDAPMPMVVDVHTTAGTFRIGLDGATAPLGVASFVHLAQSGALTGLPFHRVVPAVVVQSGDPRLDGMGGPPWWLPLEAGTAGFDAGSVGLAPAGDGLVTGQWFVVPTHQPQLDGVATRIGVVVQGLHVVRRLTPQDEVLSVQVSSAEGP